MGLLRRTVVPAGHREQTLQSGADRTELTRGHGGRGLAPGVALVATGGSDEDGDLPHQGKTLTGQESLEAPAERLDLQEEPTMMRTFPGPVMGAPRGCPPQAARQETTVNPARAKCRS